MSGFLEVGLSEDGKEVVVNHPDLQPDARGVGHIVFSPREARNFALLLLAKADETSDREPQPVDIVRHLFELSDNPRSPWGLKFAAFVIHDLRIFRDKAIEELRIVEREIGVPSEALKLANLTQQRLAQHAQGDGCIRPRLLQPSASEIKEDGSEMTNEHPLLALARFGEKCLDAHREEFADLGGDWLQEAAVECGLLKEVEVTEACDPDNCRCAEYGDFPQTCYKLTEKAYLIEPHAHEPCEHLYGQDREWKWSQACPCKRCKQVTDQFRFDQQIRDSSRTGAVE